MSIYVKNVVKAGAPAPQILEYKYLTLKDIEYLMEITPFNTAGWILRDAISAHPLVTIDWLLDHPLTSEGVVRWNGEESLLLNPNITTATVEKYPDFGWDWQSMHEICDLNREFILAHIGENWNWNDMSKVVKIAFIVENPHLDWCHYTLSLNPTVTLAQVEAHPEFDWCADNLILNPNVQNDVDTLLDFISRSPESEMSVFMEMLILVMITEPITDVLVTKLLQFQWFVQSRGYIRYKYEQVGMLNPSDIDETILRVFSLATINEMVAKYTEKIESEIANAIVTNIDLGTETNCGIRQKIRRLL